MPIRLGRPELVQKESAAAVEIYDGVAIRREPLEASPAQLRPDLSGRRLGPEICLVIVVGCDFEARLGHGYRPPQFPPGFGSTAAAHRNICTYRGASACQEKRSRTLLHRSSAR